MTLIDELRAPEGAALDEARASLSSLVSVGVLSFRAPQTIRNTLARHRESGLIDSVGEFFVWFNELSETDRAIAAEAGVDFAGSAENGGIYGGFRAIAERATKPYVLILENDITPLPGADVRGCIESCTADMIANDIKIFSLRSRRHLGEGCPYRKYLSYFGAVNPFVAEVAPHQPSALRQIKMLAEFGLPDKFRSGAIYLEEEPDKVQPKAVTRLPSGHFLTDSRYRNWSNQMPLVDRRFFLDVICARVERRPDSRLLNGHQNIECALNKSWWRRRREPIGHAAEGVFTNSRLDR
ncbi:hypothetical protein T281_12170 [Rhodomicrobium udaipurense JA643]|uniref:Glycosyltransferase n=1 Tax=Rhodomicrobium udaipurense TaxID=1202716 RepID=A0A8I1GEU7_9HYPH|nr:hypothetical protein [Rhodomicrobium udaipurense]KAI94232.1 hypothetical protein T281_12170 [Rhodomicrobium udaipurense JA643]MBJ7543664.1 hypothetical protein [Rhodomicrobium udaipurense]